MGPTGKESTKQKPSLFARDLSPTRVNNLAGENSGRTKLKTVSALIQAVNKVKCFGDWLEVL